MRPVAFGRPGTEVIPAGWSAAHRPVVAGTFTGTCTIRHPGGTRGPFNNQTGTYDTVPYEPHHTGGCRIQALTGDEQDRVTGDQTVPTVGYLVVVDLAGSEGTKVGDLVEVATVDDNGDTALIGHTFTVASFTTGTLAWERDLTVLDALTPTGGA